MMKIAVVGATGRAGRYAVEALHAQGHEVVEISRAKGVDVITGEGLEAALRGAEVIIDSATGPSPEYAPAAEFFTTATRNLHEHGRDAKRIVVVSIIGIERFSGGYHAAKLEHERAHLAGPYEVRILRAAQFHEFVGQLMDWGTQNGTAYVPEMRTQLVAARSVGEALAALAVEGEGPSEIAGPRAESLVEAARLLAAKRGAPTAVQGVSDPADPNSALFKEGALLPGPDALLTGPTFEAWLAAS